VDCFWTEEGRIVPGEYFIYLLAVHLHKNPISKYQVIQTDYNDLRFRLALRPGEHMEPDIQSEIEEKTRLVMGENCRMAFEFVDDILPGGSGKYFYTVCEIPALRQPTSSGSPAKE
jgi:phenylacetate-CoA ligase